MELLKQKRKILKIVLSAVLSAKSFNCPWHKWSFFNWTDLVDNIMCHVLLALTVQISSCLFSLYICVLFVKSSRVDLTLCLFSTIGWFILFSTSVLWSCFLCFTRVTACVPHVILVYTLSRFLLHLPIRLSVLHSVLFHVSMTNLV